MKTNEKQGTPKTENPELTEDKLYTVSGGVAGLTPGRLENIGPKEDLWVELSASALEMTNVDIAKEFDYTVRSQRAAVAPQRAIAIDDGTLRKVWEIKK